MYSDISDHVIYTRERTRRPPRRKAAEQAAEAIERLCRFRPGSCICGSELDYYGDEEYQIHVLECEARYSQLHVTNIIGDSDTFVVCEEPAMRFEAMKVDAILKRGLL